MRARHAVLAAALLLPVAAGADGEGDVNVKGTDKAPSHHPLGCNRQGADEWWRAKDDAIVIHVPAGPYVRRPYQGGAATEPPEPVELKSYFIDKHEVTNSQFARFLNATGAKDDTPLLRGTVRGLEMPEDVWRPHPGMERHPVTACTGRGALEYAAWAGVRLPTADEWMKAAGGPEGRLYPWGDAEPDEARANFGRPARRGLEPVGSHPFGASPYGCLDMAGNAYDRVMTRVRGRDGTGEALPVMLKGGSWVSAHPLNLRVLDLCMQPVDVADGSVGFRCAMDDPPPGTGPTFSFFVPVLRLARDFDAAVAEARSRKVPIFLSLLHDTCGQCDRTIAQCYRDSRFVRFCNENMVVVLGHQPWDADDRPHAVLPDGTCTVHPGLTCREHEELYRRGLAVVGGFRTSPGNFVLDPAKVVKGAGAKAVLVPEERLPKWGDDVDAYLDAFEEARKRMAAE